MFDHHSTTTGITRRIGRLAAVTVAAAVGVVGLTAAPAAADQPIDDGFTASWVDVNPCTGEPMEVTVHFEARVHLHDNGNVIVSVSRTGTTSDGYEMEHGNETFVLNGNVARGTVNDMFRNADGSIFKAQGFFVENGDGVLADGLRLRCVTP